MIVRVLLHGSERSTVLERTIRAPASIVKRCLYLGPCFGGAQLQAASQGVITFLRLVGCVASQAVDTHVQYLFMHVAGIAACAQMLPSYVQ